MGKIIEKQALCEYPFGVRRNYHSFTRDWITNEIFRRVHPEGLTMGESMSQEIHPNFPELDLYVTTLDEDD
jgi:hypothetical protein